MGPLPLPPPVFAILSGLVEERAGLHYGPADLALFNEKVSSRALDRGFESLLDYYYFLRYDPAGEAELLSLLEHLVVHETYFFRELEQLRYAADHVARKVTAGERPRVWCAAASTGEEPLTFAMLLSERGVLSKVELIASDLSDRALAIAQRGKYSERAIRSPQSSALRSRFLTHVPGGGWTIAPELLRSIQWRRENLLAPDPSIAGCDVILCRNVLIYFRDQQVRSVVSTLAERLAPEGLLFVGVSESLLRFTEALVCEEHAGAFFYRKAVRP
ncbi:MAG: CheR family methyltransferase [Myxococcaceae bacterium]